MEEAVTHIVIGPCCISMLRMHQLNLNDAIVRLGVTDRMSSAATGIDVARPDRPYDREYQYQSSFVETRNTWLWRISAEGYALHGIFIVCALS
jgi:hypothetical protein